jgi:putative transposase
MARKVKFSSNWRKARARVARLQRKIASLRNDMLHKSTTTISKSHALVAMEDLRITSMTASAKGTAEAPGTNVRAKSMLNRRILDQGWGEFRRQLDYKLKWTGGTLVLVDPRNTSRTCARCGYVSRDNRQSQTVFRCAACGYAANADTNAAINILRRAGQAQIACGDSPMGESAKQEAQHVA